MTLEPGPELDRLIAEKVMGTSKVEVNFISSVNQERGILTTSTELRHMPYSTEIKDAWEVVEKLKETFDLQIELFKGEGKTNVHLITYDEDEEPDSFVTYGDTPAHAICLAALRAVE